MTIRHRSTSLALSLSLCAAALACAQTPPHGEARTAPQMDRLDRGLVARQTEQGVYLGWRLLNSDPDKIAFHVYRSTPDGQPQKLNDVALQQTTDFVDSSTLTESAEYTIRPVVGGVEKEPCASVTVDASRKPASCIAIKLNGNHTVQKAGIADLNGDGKLDFVVKTPNENIDPYEQYWKPSPDTYKLEAYLHDGTFLWRYDLGWAIERGIWYSPYVVYDLDGDGKAEVAVKTGEGDPRDQDGRVQTGPE